MVSSNNSIALTVRAFRLIVIACLVEGVRTTSVSVYESILNPPSIVGRSHRAACSSLSETKASHHAVTNRRGYSGSCPQHHGGMIDACRPTPFIRVADRDLSMLFVIEVGIAMRAIANSQRSRSPPRWRVVSVIIFSFSGLDVLTFRSNRERLATATELFCWIWTTNEASYIHGDAGLYSLNWFTGLPQPLDPISASAAVESLPCQGNL